MAYDTLPSTEVIEATAAALTANGFQVSVLDTAAAVSEQVHAYIPEGSQVMTMTSETLDKTGVSALINESGTYIAAKPKLYALDSATQKDEQKKLGMMSPYVIGSVNALTQDGKLVWASATGSQIPAYAYGSEKVVLVIGAQKITKDLPDALERINSYVLPLESERAKKAYGVPGSVVSRLFIYNSEFIPGRIRIFLVKESLGY